MLPLNAFFSCSIVSFIISHTTNISFFKLYIQDSEQLDSLKLILETLLKDSSTMVLGSTVAALNEVCPEDYNLLHRNHRKLCHLLADMDEWTQVRGKRCLHVI